MDEPVLTQLFDEAAVRCTDIAAGGEASASAAAAVAGHAQSLGSLIAHEADALHNDMAQAIDAVRHAREQATQAAAAAAELLDGLPARVEHAEAEVKALLSAVLDDVQHLEQSRQHLLQGLAASSDETDASFQALAGKIQELIHRLDARIHDAEVNLAALQTAVSEAQSHVHDGGEKLRASLKKLSMAAKANTWAMDTAVYHALWAIADDVVGLCNSAIDGHNELVTAVRHNLTSETPGGGQPAETWLMKAAKPMHDVFAELAQFPEQIKNVVHGPVSTTLEMGEKAITALAEIGESARLAIPEEA